MAGFLSLPIEIRVQIYRELEAPGFPIGRRFKDYRNHNWRCFFGEPEYSLGWV